MPDTPLACQRDRFALPEDVHYLNCAYMGPLPRSAEQAGVEALARKRVPIDLGPDDFFAGSDRVREKFARLVGCPDPTRVALHPAVSYGVATAARNLPLSSGARVVLLEEQFPGNVYAWRRLAEEAGARVVTVARPAGARAGAEWNARILEALTPEVEIVAVPPVHWTDGTRFDLEAIGERARAVGAALVVDATQATGAVPLRLEDFQPDVFVTAAYKWLLGPYSLAYTFLSERFDHGVPLEETWLGREGSEDFQGLVNYTDAYQPGAIRYDVGERSNFALMPVASAALDLILEWGPERVSAYVRDLTADLLERAVALGFGVEEDAWRSPHLFGLRMPERVELHQVRQALQHAGVYASLRGSALRISPNVYNTPADVAALVEVLEVVAG